MVFSVSVRNDLTGEVRTIVVPCDFPADAQIRALHALFHSDGWRRATAQVPAEVADAA